MNKVNIVLITIVNKDNGVNSLANKSKETIQHFSVC